MTDQRRFATAGPAPGRGGRRAAAQAVRLLSWAVPVACAVLALGGGARAWLLGAGAVASAAVAWLYRRFLGDYARSLLVEPQGWLEVTREHLVVRHAGVLAADVAIPWPLVRAVCVDDGAQALPTRSEPARRFPIGAAEAGSEAAPGALFNGPRPGFRTRRGGTVALLASAPAVPNVVVLLDPPAELPWHYPFITGPFNPPRGQAWTARPWATPASTPAFFAAMADPAGLAAAVAGYAPVREAERADAEYLAGHGLA